MTPVICAATGNKLVEDDAVLGDGIFLHTRRATQRLQANKTVPRAAIPYKRADEIRSTGTNTNASTDMALGDALDPTGYTSTSKTSCGGRKLFSPVPGVIMVGDLSLVNTEGRMPYEEVESIADASRSVPAPTADLAELLRLEEGLRTPEYAGLTHQQQASANKK